MEGEASIEEPKAAEETKPVPKEKGGETMVGFKNIYKSMVQDTSLFGSDQAN